MRQKAAIAAAASVWILVNPSRAAGVGVDSLTHSIHFEHIDDIPTELRVADGHSLILEAVVTEGTQTYRCTPERKFALIAPTAMLRGRAGEFTAHFAGPSWQFEDGSIIVGKVIAHVARANAIDRLLLQVVQHSGPNGLFTSVDFVQRLATVGGVAPAECDPIKNPTIVVPYSAIYQFWAPAALTAP